MRTIERRWAAGLVLAAGAVLTGCASRDQLLLEEFFGASRLRDTIALQAVATVIFEPLQQGIVRTFEIIGATQEGAHEGIVTREVTIEAAVILGDGPPVLKTLVVTLQRGSTGAKPARWMVTGVREQAASRSIELPSLP